MWRFQLLWLSYLYIAKHCILRCLLIEKTNGNWCVILEQLDVVLLPNDNNSSATEGDDGDSNSSSNATLHIQPFDSSVFICVCHYVVWNIQIFMSFVSHLELTLHHLTHMSTTNSVHFRSPMFHRTAYTHTYTFYSSWLEWNARLRNVYCCQCWHFFLRLSFFFCLSIFHTLFLLPFPSLSLTHCFSLPLSKNIIDVLCELIVST